MTCSVIKAQHCNALNQHVRLVMHRLTANRVEYCVQLDDGELIFLSSDVQFAKHMFDRLVGSTAKDAVSSLCCTA